MYNLISRGNAIRYRFKFPDLDNYPGEIPDEIILSKIENKKYNI